ncbi:hypothetical protein E3U43_010370 [Larimichthys crocea]|uniref:Uncharacterized protein n=1 Tax=Larimichthys crocea TaxID=215358 RepID=A0ACD3RF06_LARCR|nr:hypothetical protein E3U43_010370 [Larimichthys crocea]
MNLQAELQTQSSSQTSNTQDELTRFKRSSCGDIQQYLQGGLKALEDRYEPILLALLKRREVTSGALVKAKEHCPGTEGPADTPTGGDTKAEAPEGLFGGETQTNLHAKERRCGAVQGNSILSGGAQQRAED